MDSVKWEKVFIKEEPQDYLESMLHKIKIEKRTFPVPTCSFFRHGNLAVKRNLTIKREAEDSRVQSPSKYLKTSPSKITSIEESEITPEDVKVAVQLSSAATRGYILPIEEVYIKEEVNAENLAPSNRQTEENDDDDNLSLEEASTSRIDDKGRLRFDCSRCGKSFFLLSQLTAHIASHLAEKNFLCSSCKKPFKAQQIKGFHTKCKSKKVATFNCLLCKKILLDHQVSMHERYHNGRFFVHCPGCKYFLRFRDVHYHANCSESRKILCNLCNKTLVGRTHYLMHYHLHKCSNLLPIGDRQEEEIKDHVKSRGAPVLLPYRTRHGRPIYCITRGD